MLPSLPPAHPEFAVSNLSAGLFSKVRADWLLRVSLGWCDAQRGAEAAAEQKGISFSDTFGRKDCPDELRRMLRHMCQGRTQHANRATTPWALPAMHATTLICSLVCISSLPGLAKDMESKSLKGTKMTIKLKDSAFNVRCRSADGLGRAISSADDLYRRALPMFERELKLGRAGNAALPFEALELRSIGVQVGRLLASPASLTCTGLCWPALAFAGLHWPSLALDGLHWPSLALADLRWPSLFDGLTDDEARPRWRHVA